LILIDSSVWIDYFRGTITPQTERLDGLLGVEPLAIGDLILAEVLQWFSNDHDFETAQRLLESLTFIELGGLEIAIKSARNFRSLRQRGLTIRKTIDCVIATRCIEDGLTLLHKDRDFDAFAKYLGLQVLV